MGVFNKTIIPFALVGNEMFIANSYPTRTPGITVNYYYKISNLQTTISTNRLAVCLRAFKEYSKIRLEWKTKELVKNYCCLTSLKYIPK